MLSKLLVGGAIAATAFVAVPRPQSTPAPVAATYDSLADAILAVKASEEHLVRSILDGHFHAAEAYFSRNEFGRASAEVALFANEGDNAIGGVRKRLLEGGHHHHSDGEAKGIYEPGYVVVTREAKEKALALSAALRSADDANAAKAAWTEFETLAKRLLKRG